MKRLPWGSGSISGPDAEGSYEIRLSLGIVDGKRQRVRRRAASRSEAMSVLEEMRATYGKHRGRGAPPTLRAYVEGWLAARALELEPKSIRNYAFGAGMMLERLGHVRIDRLTSQ